MTMVVLGETPDGIIPRSYYDPTTAQFTTPDPLFSLTGSRYGYTDNNPLNGSDPSGLAICWGPIHLGYCPSPQEKLQKQYDRLEKVDNALSEKQGQMYERADALYGSFSGVDFWGLTESPFDCAERASELVDSEPIAQAVSGVEEAMTAVQDAEVCASQRASACGEALVSSLGTILAGLPDLGFGPGVELAFDTIEGVLKDSAGVFDCVGHVLQDGTSDFHGCSSI